MGYDERGLGLGDLVDGGLDDVFGFVVEGGGGLVEQENWGVLVDVSGHVQPLLLPPRQPIPPDPQIQILNFILTAIFLNFLFQEIESICGFQGLYESPSFKFLIQNDVLFQIVWENESILGNVRNVLPEHGKVNLVYVYIVYQNQALGDPVEPEQ